jgi:hypothetical protein
LTLIWWGASSIASALAMWAAAPLEIVYGRRFGRGRRPAIEAVMMMLPPPASFMIGTIFCAAMNSALTLTSMIRSHSASVDSSSGLVRNGRPALAK